MERLMKALADHETSRKRAINMIASENRTSPLVRMMMASDLAHRYSDELYGGSIHARQIIEACEKILQQLFRAEHVLVTPLSGNFAVLSAVLGLTKPGGVVAKVRGEDGGYPLNIEAFQRSALWLHFDPSARSIDIDASRAELLARPPALVMLGQSVFTHPHPVTEMRELIDRHSLKCPLVFDGSHVLGLIAGGEFQDPLRQGADVLLGSTHKTFFGPQGGVVLSNDRGVFRKI
ncbi:MAG: serine hydroxymethyltransferase, partial [Candidatus Sigynarchaeum springense]